MFRVDDSSDSKLKITPFGEALSIHQTSIYNMQKAIIPIGLRLLLFFSAMTESIFIPMQLRACREQTSN